VRVVGSITARASLWTSPAGATAAPARAVASQLARFGLVGLSNTALSWCLYALAVSVGVWYPLAAAASFAVGAVNGYTLNRVWTFRAGAFSASQLGRYVTVQAGAMAVNVTLLVILVEWIGLQRLTAQLVALVAVAALGFTAARGWAFAVAGEETLPRPMSRPRLVLPRPSLSSRTLLRALATLSVLALGTGCVAAVLVVSAKRSFLSPPSRVGFPPWLAGPWHQVGISLPQRGFELIQVFAIVIGATMACYLVVVALARWVPTPVVVGAVVLLHVVFLLSPPFPLTDVFSYLGYARLGALHGLNPFTHAPVAVRHDAAYHLSTWHHLPTPYGPLFTAGTYALVPLGIVKGYWALKGLTVLASLGCMALLWRCARALDRPPAPVLVFVGLNPLLLAYGLGGFHNDFFMMLLVLGAVLLVLRGRSALGGASAAAAVAIKVAAGVFVPFILLGARRRAVALAGAVGSGAMLLAGAIAMFGTRDPGLVDQASKVVGPYSVTSELGLVFGFGIDATTRHVLAAIMVVTMVVLIVRTWRGADWIVTAGWAGLALAATSVQPMPWYVVWALPFAALGRSRTLRAATLALGVVLLVNSSPIQNLLLTNKLHLHGVGPTAGRATRALLH
jgi:putative flippase GtrA